MSSSMLAWTPFRLAVSAGILYGMHLLDLATVHRPVNENIYWLNNLVNSYIVPQWLEDATGGMSHLMRTYARNVIAGSLLYHITANLWALYIYGVKRSQFFPDPTKMPTTALILEQIVVAQTSLLSYALLPLFASFVAERGYSLTYYYVSEVGWVQYFCYLVVYLTLVEIGIYWMHRELHQVKWMYNYIHLPHHKYNKPEEMSPYASIAFHPLDGILQACPYVILTFFIPMHYITSLIMFSFTAIWATSIHDNVEAMTEPLMGAKYHTGHHVYYRCNYGQFFIYCDWLWGTLRVPGEKKAKNL